MSSNNTPTISSILEIVSSQIRCNKLFQTISLKITISEIKPYNSMYFLQVYDDTNSIPAVIYGSSYTNSLKPTDTIIASCRLGLYKSQVQLIINKYKHVEYIQSDFDKALQYIKNLGWLDTPKPDISTNYTTIGIISSINAAGFKDFCYTICNRCTGKIFYLYNTKVQGLDADTSMIHAINFANKHNVCQVLALIRGGGSKEDLSCFNSEKLASAIYNSAIPIVTGIGHQIDKSIADLVSAKSYITPTALAENIVVSNLPNDIFDKLNHTNMQTLHKIKHLLNRRLNYIETKRLLLSQYKQNILTGYENIIMKNTSKLMLKPIHNVHTYLTTNINLLSQHMKNYTQTLQNNITQYECTSENLKSHIQKYIDKTNNELSTFSKIYMYDTNDNLILSKAQLVQGLVYKIKIMDEYVNVKIL